MRDKRGIWRGRCLSCTDCDEYEPGTDVNPCGYCGCPPGAHIRTASAGQEPPATTTSSSDSRSDAFHKLPEGRKLKLGWLPHPQAAKTKFSNTILPRFYGAFYPTCPDDKRFQTHFLQERNREFQSKAVTEKCQKTLSFVEGDNPASARRFLQEGFHIKSSHDKVTCQQNMEKLENTKQILLKERSNIADHDSTLFKADGRHLRSGYSTMHEYNLEQLENIDQILKSVQATHHRLEMALQRLKRFFCEEEPKQGRAARVQKGSRQKIKRRKSKRLDTNTERILRAIAPDASPSDQVTAEMIDSEEIASLTYQQGRYIYKMLKCPNISEDGKDMIRNGLNDSAKKGLQVAHQNWHKACQGECKSEDCTFDQKAASLFQMLGGQIYKTMYAPELTGLPQLGLDELDRQTLEDCTSTMELAVLLKKGCFEESVEVLVREKLDGWS